MATLTDYVFPVPPVCTAKWTDADWLRWAETRGHRIGKPPLSEAAGKYLHVEQNAPISPFGIKRDGTTYQTLPSWLFKRHATAGLLCRVKDTREADWASGSYLIGPDGSLTFAHDHYDSSD